MDTDNATELRAMQEAGRNAALDGRARRAPPGLLLCEGKAWYSGYDEAEPPPPPEIEDGDYHQYIWGAEQTD